MESENGDITKKKSQIDCVITKADGTKLISSAFEYWENDSKRTVCFEFDFEDEHKYSVTYTSSEDQLFDYDLKDISTFLNMNLVFNDIPIMSIGIKSPSLTLDGDHYTINTESSYSFTRLFVDESSILRKVVVESDSAEMSCVLYSSSLRKTNPKLDGVKSQNKKKRNSTGGGKSRRVNKESTRGGKNK